MDIKPSRRILAVGAPGSRVLDVIRKLTGSAPDPAAAGGSTAGLNHEWECRTAYFHATIPIWVDEVGDVEGWKEDFLKGEAREVVEAVGAWVYCFERPEGDGRVSGVVEGVMRAVQEVVESHVAYGSDVAMLAVCLPGKEEKEDVGGLERHIFEEWEDACLQFGFEFIDFAGHGRNSFGEKQGFERLKEALESTDWTGDEHVEEDLDFDDLDFDAIDPFTGERGELNRELWGLKAALMNHRDTDDEDETGKAPYYGDEAEQVDALERLMGKVMTVKEDISDLPEEQRKRKAAQAVQEMMKNHPNI